MVGRTLAFLFAAGLILWVTEGFGGGGGRILTGARMTVVAFSRAFSSSGRAL
jgi:hypothetical protein